MDAVKAIETLGGLSAAARALNLTHSTVQYWQQTNRIPAWRQEAVQKALAASKAAKGDTKRKRRAA